MTTTIQAGQKEALASQPYMPDMAHLPELVGKERHIELITAAWMGGPFSRPMAPLLLGEPGVGKNRLVYELAQLTGKELYIFQGHEDVTAEDLACAVRFSDDPRKKMDYVASPLVTAMKLGGICFIDEIAKIRPRALALLVSVLDERRYIDSTLLGERVRAHNGFRFIAATNTADLEGNLMPEFIQSRMRPVIPVGYPSEKEIMMIIDKQFPKVGKKIDCLMKLFWDMWKEMNTNKPPTPRDAIYIFNLATNIADLEAFKAENKRTGSRHEQGVPLEGSRHALSIENKHLEAAFFKFFMPKAVTDRKEVFS